MKMSYFMQKKLLIDASHREETRIVLLDRDQVEEFDFESGQKKQLSGNIFLAKVTRVEPSLQAAFLDYGGNRHGFLAFSEIHPDYYQIPVADKEALLAEAKILDEQAEELFDKELDDGVHEENLKSYVQVSDLEDGTIRSEPLESTEENSADTKSSNSKIGGPERELTNQSTNFDSGELNPSNKNDSEPALELNKKEKALSEAFRVLKRGGQIRMRDLIKVGELPQEVLIDPLSFNTSLGGAEDEESVRIKMKKAGFSTITISDHQPFSYLNSVRIAAKKSKY